MASKRLPVQFRPAPPMFNIWISASNADEDYSRNYNGPKVANVGRPTKRWHFGEIGRSDARDHPGAGRTESARAQCADVFVNLRRGFLFSRASSNSRTSGFQPEYVGASPSARSTREPILWRGSPSAKRCARVRFPLGSLES
jgi:hypothetical protein